MVVDVDGDMSGGDVEDDVVGIGSAEREYSVLDARALDIGRTICDRLDKFCAGVDEGTESE